jgi:ion channel-forming bestrophin family protein
LYEILVPCHLNLATKEMGDRNIVVSILSANDAIDLRKSVFLTIWRQVIVSMIIATVIVIADRQGIVSNKLTTDLFSPVVILGLFIFRIYLAHCMFAESCKLWYSIIDASRIICRNISIIIPVNNTEELRVKKDYLRLVGILIITIKLHLQNESIDVDPGMRKFLSKELYSELRETNCAPIRVINLLGEYFHRIFYIKQIIDRELFIDLNHSLDRLTTIFSDCQRISNACIAGYFLIYFKYFIVFYTIILPWQFAEELDWFTIPVVGIISYILLGIEDVIVKIENPFNSKYNKKYLDKTCQNLQSEIALEWIEYSGYKPKLSDLIDR